MNNQFKAQILTGNPTGNSRCNILASRALSMSGYFDQSARSIESRTQVRGYRYWYQDWDHCGVTNDLGSSPQPEGEARGLWWAFQVVGNTTMTEIEVSISILSWCLNAF